MPTQQPPPIPPSVPQPVADYLNKLSLWMFQELSRKIPKDEATPNLVLAAHDAKLNPNIFRIQVTNAGTLQAVPIPLGGKNPGSA